MATELLKKNYKTTFCKPIVKKTLIFKTLIVLLLTLSFSFLFFICLVSIFPLYNSTIESICKIFHLHYYKFSWAPWSLTAFLASAYLLLLPTAFANTFQKILFRTVFWRNLYFLSKKIYDSSNYDKITSENGDEPMVGIVVPTCDDFDYELWEQNIKQDYKKFTLFILDDSKEQDYIKEIDNFKLKYIDKVVVIRREVHNNAKVGNTNNFFVNFLPKNPQYKYEYYCFFDADSILPKNMISVNIKLFYTPYQIDYVTMQTSACNNTTSKFANFIYDRVDYATSHFLLENFMGEASYLGWAGMFRYQCLEDIGFWPMEVINDDQGLQYSLYKNNKVGLFSNLVCISSREPLNYYSYAKRERRWMRGNAQFLINFHLKQNVKKEKDMSKEIKKCFLRKTYTYTMNFPLVLFFLSLVNITIFCFPEQIPFFSVNSIVENFCCIIIIFPIIFSFIWNSIWLAIISKKYANSNFTFKRWVKLFLVTTPIDVGCLIVNKNVLSSFVFGWKTKCLNIKCWSEKVNYRFYVKKLAKRNKFLENKLNINTITANEREEYVKNCDIIEQISEMVIKRQNYKEFILKTIDEKYYITSTCLGTDKPIKLLRAITIQKFDRTPKTAKDLKEDSNNENKFTTSLFFFFALNLILSIGICVISIALRKEQYTVCSLPFLIYAATYLLEFFYSLSASTNKIKKLKPDYYLYKPLIV